MAPPVRVRWENRGQPTLWSQYVPPLVSDSSTMTAPSGCVAATTAHIEEAVSFPSAGMRGGGGGLCAGSVFHYVLTRAFARLIGSNYGVYACVLTL